MQHTRDHVHSVALLLSLLLHVPAPAEGGAQRRRLRGPIGGGGGSTFWRLGLGIQALGALQVPLIFSKKKSVRDRCSHA